MKLGYVIASANGTLPHKNTLQHKTLSDARLMTVQPLNEQLQSAGAPHLAVDTVGVKAGDLVLLAKDEDGAQQEVHSEESPFQTLIIGVINRADVMAREEVSDIKGTPA